jgi:heme/copper-type cytochrome/quinol oxidase subunit 2
MKKVRDMSPGFTFLKKTPSGAMNVNVTARQWSWLFEYENGIKTTELRIPLGKPVKLSLTSQDVIHGFYAPSFRIKQDVVPGMIYYNKHRDLELHCIYEDMFDNRDLYHRKLERQSKLGG